MQAVREEQQFFKLEMAEEAKSENGVRQCLFLAYRCLSDYGFSINRPIIGLVFITIIFAMLYGLLSVITQCTFNTSLNTVCVFSPKWLEFVLIQALPLPGFDKITDVVKLEIFANNSWLSLIITILVVFQKSFSILCLFLIGLALKNQFKFK